MSLNDNVYYDETADWYLYVNDDQLTDFYDYWYDDDIWDTSHIISIDNGYKTTNYHIKCMKTSERDLCACQSNNYGPIYECQQHEAHISAASALDTNMYTDYELIAPFETIFIEQGYINEAKYHHLYGVAHIILLERENANIYRSTHCSGVLIDIDLSKSIFSEQLQSYSKDAMFVLTAAHCLYKSYWNGKTQKWHKRPQHPKNMAVRFYNPTYHQNELSMVKQMIEFPAKDLIIDTNYNSDPSPYDFGLIVFWQDKADANGAKIQNTLPKWEYQIWDNMDKSLIEPKSRISYAGYSKSDYLQIMHYQYIPYDEYKSIKYDKKWHNEKVYKDFVFAIAPTLHNAHSGGPIYYIDDGEPVIVAVYSGSEVASAPLLDAGSHFGYMYKEQRAVKIRKDVLGGIFAENGHINQKTPPQSLSDMELMEEKHNKPNDPNDEHARMQKWMKGNRKLYNEISQVQSGVQEQISGLRHKEPEG